MPRHPLPGVVGLSAQRPFPPSRWQAGWDVASPSHLFPLDATCILELLLASVGGSCPPPCQAPTSALPRLGWAV